MASQGTPPLPEALVPPDRAVRRARRRRRAVLAGIITLLVLPPFLWVAFARGTAPADGTFSYPSDPSWSDADGVEISAVVTTGSADQDGPCSVVEGDRVTSINGLPLRAWAGGETGRPRPVAGNTLTYAVDKPSPSSDCKVAVRLGGFPWLAILRKNLGMLVLAAVMWSIASVVFLQRPRDPAARALFAIALLVPYTATAAPLTIQVVDLTQGPRLWPFVWGEVATGLLWGAVLHFGAVFPRPLPFLRGRPFRLVAIYAVPFALHVAQLAIREPSELGSNLLSLALPATAPSPDFADWSVLLPVSVMASRVVPILVALTLLWQYRHVETTDERRRMQWVIYSFLFVATLYLALYQVPAGLLDRPLVSEQVQALIFVIAPVALGAAVLRFGIFDLQIILRRSLVYGALTVALVVIPALATLTLAEALGLHPTGLELALIVALVVAVLFQTLRARLKRRISKLIFGDRDDPYELVSQLGSRLQSSAPAETLLSAVAETVARALRLPYVAIELDSPDGVVDAEHYGERQGTVLTLPLVNQGERVGRLLLDPGVGREPFGPADRKLVELLTQQVGFAAQSVLLTGRLQRSLQRAVVAREEERRRMRRDIHDGLGPMLAASKMQLELARQLLGQRPDVVPPILNELVETQKAVILDVRTLVEGLRPPVLDQLGLVSAIRERANALSIGDRGQGITFTVEAADDVEPLPAAVEVGAYRVALEAMTNVVRHAQAERCWVRLWRADGLLLEVADDGRGLPDVYRAGVGVNSMRERATELGGSCSILPGAGGGTVVLARFPVVLG